MYRPAWGGSSCLFSLYDITDYITSWTCYTGAKGIKVCCIYWHVAASSPVLFPSVEENLPPPVQQRRGNFAVTLKTFVHHQRFPIGKKKATPMFTLVSISCHEFVFLLNVFVFFVTARSRVNTPGGCGFQRRYEHCWTPKMLHDVSALHSSRGGRVWPLILCRIRKSAPYIDMKRYANENA